MLRPGYLELENGYAVTENGTLMIAVRTDMGNGMWPDDLSDNEGLTMHWQSRVKNITGGLDGILSSPPGELAPQPSLFSFLDELTAMLLNRYKLWNPVAHQYAWRYPNSLDWANKTYPERYFNTFSFIDEYLGNDAYKLTVAFIDPSELGFDPSEFAEHNIETMVVAHIHSGSKYTLFAKEGD